jgi:hypothetical protein
MVVEKLKSNLNVQFLLAILLAWPSALLAEGGLSTYSFALKGEKSPNPNIITQCGLNVEIDEIGSTDLAVASPNYTVTFSIPGTNNINRKVKLKGKTKWGVPMLLACNTDTYVYLNEIIEWEWAPVKQKLEGTKGWQCVEQGLRFFNEKISGENYGSKVYLRPADEKSSKIARACDQILSDPLQERVSCTLNTSGARTTCEEKYYSSTNPNSALSAERALHAILRGEEVKKSLRETAEAKKERLENEQREDERRRAEQAERDKIAKQQEERERWLRTPEGRKYLANEAEKQKRVDEERRKTEAARRAKFASDFPFYALITCSIQGQHVHISACFSGRVDTHVELRNGTEYGLYKFYELQKIGEETSEGFTINLRRTFSLKAQNASGDLILGVKIVDRSSNSVKFQKQVAKYNVIAVGNN